MGDKLCGAGPAINKLCGDPNPDYASVICWREHGHSGNHHADADGACHLWTGEIDELANRRKLT